MTDDAAPDDPWKAADESWRAWQAVTAPEDAANHGTDAYADADAAEPAGPRSLPDGAVIELREVTKDDVRAICRLAVAPAQMSFVAPNAISFAEALFDPKAWYRAIYADGNPVGFAMLSIDRDVPEYYLWRFMIDARHQGRGYGRVAIGLIVAFVRTLPEAHELLVSWVPADGGPEPFYRSLGFVPTGAVEDNEVVARLIL